MSEHVTEWAGIEENSIMTLNDIYLYPVAMQVLKGFLEYRGALLIWLQIKL